MKRTSLSSRDRRAMAVGLAVLAPALLYYGVVKPYVGELRKTHDRVVIERDALARERALLELVPRQAAIHSALDSVVTTEREQLFEAPDDGIAAAEVGAYLGTLAREHDVWLRAADARVSTASPNGLRALPVDIQTESDFEGVRSFLWAMEHGPKRLRIDQLTIAPGADTSASRPVLQLRAVVTGYALGAATGGTPIRTPPSRSDRR